MATKFTLKDFEQADGVLRAAESRRHFIIHAILYALVNIVLTISNVLLAPAFPWAIIPIVFWGIALLTHYFVAFRWMQRVNEQWMAKVEYLAEERHRANELLMRKAG